MPNEVLLVEKIGAVTRLSLNRPEAMNALNLAVVAAFDRAIDEILADDAVRAVIITATGTTFCAGADLKDAQAQHAPGEKDFLDHAWAMFNRLRVLPKPVIVALNGLTLAGGLELAMTADIILASDTAKLGDAHANFGVYPGAGGAAVLPRMVPLQTALYLLYTGRSLPAQRMYELGLVCEVYPAEELQAAALKLAEQISAKSPASLRRMKEVARAANDKSEADALLHEQVLLRQHTRSADYHEGLNAFVEKRKPVFTGR